MIHTPGPWNRIPGDKNVYSSAGVVCRRPQRVGNTLTCERWEPNAHLIAAAPEMYEALVEQDEVEQIFTDFINALNPDFTLTEKDQTRLHELREKRRAALAKARGES